MSDIKDNKIYKIKRKRQLLGLIKYSRLLCILTNGLTVYACKTYSIDFKAGKLVVPQVSSLKKDYTWYCIEKNGRLLHLDKINYPVLSKFVKHWFPDCYYAKHIREYDSHDGLFLFQKISPAQDFIRRCHDKKVIAGAQSYRTFDKGFNKKTEKFILFTEDNEMPDRPPHAHVCVNINNKEYKGNPLRDEYWAEWYKSIFSVRLIDIQHNKDDEPYKLDNLIVEEEVEKDCYCNMPQKDKEQILFLLNREKTALWCNYLTNVYIENEENKNE